MSDQLPKAYDPASVETQVNQTWNAENLFHAEPSDPGDSYSIVIPPPNVTAALHLGHALNNTLQDILTRWHRMKGDNTCWFPGTDHAGIATQTVVEKRVLAEEGKRRTDYQRDEFVKKIQAWKDEYEKRITDQLKRMGCSCDYARQAFTMDDQRARAVREAFYRLFKDGLIYRGKRLVNWDPVTQTALADDEVEMEEVDGQFYYLRYPILPPSPGTPGEGWGEGDLRYVTVATTRPETMLGDTAVAINPKDPRAAKLKGKQVRLPIVNRIVAIIEDDYVVLPDPNSQDAKAQFATGFLKVTPAHDPNDYEIGQRHNLPIVNVFSPTATISKDHGWPAGDFAQGAPELTHLLGLDRFEAREAVLELFRKANLLEETKPYKHSVGHSYRSHVPIEPYLSDQWYVATTKQISSLPDEGKVEGTNIAKNSLAGMALRAISSMGVPPMPAERHGRDAHATENWEGRLKIVPDRYAKTYQAWHENIRDWCISRQLWWGHRIPVWRLPEGRLADRLSPQAFEAAVEKLAKWSSDGRIALTLRSEDPAARAQDIADRTLPFGFAAARDPNDREVIDALESFGAQQDPDVLDTWFSSGLWPLSTMCWPEDTPELAKWNPTSVLCTAREIITLWVSRMVMFNLYFRSTLPFYDVFIHAMIQDGHGQKMSKTLGNGLDPVDIIQSHGADAMRFALTAMTTHTQDIRMPVDIVDPFSGETFTPKFIDDGAGHKVAAPVQESPKEPAKKMVSSYGLASGKATPTKDMPAARNTSSKFDNGRNFCSKLWNAARFAMMNLAGAPDVGATPASRAARQASPLQDQWIISRFNRTVADATAALDSYRFDAYAKACYDFFWGDLCDWYLEAIKPAMKDPQRAGTTANVLAAVLDGALRLMHPMIPFITEFIWWKLNDIRPERNLPGQIESKPSKRLIQAAFPTIGPFSESAEQNFAKLQEIIVAIRNMRNEYKVDPKKPVTVWIQATDELARQLTGNREIIELLATCTLTNVAPAITAPPDSARAVAAGAEIFIEGLVDRAAEQQRVAKRCEELKRQQSALRGRLSNESYIAKAPPHLVQQTRDQLAQVEAEMTKLGCS